MRLWVRHLLAACLLVPAVIAFAEGRPEPRPAGLARAGAVCGDPRLVGTELPAIAGDGVCGIDAPVALARAAGVALDPPATVACPTARALADWLGQGPLASFARQGAALEQLVVVDAYSCRNRNRQEAGKLSQHALGRAIDVSGFGLRDGRTVTVLDGWTSPEWGPPLRRIHAAGCGRFGTVLGPEANALHADHLHLDVEERRSGAYCE